MQLDQQKKINVGFGINLVKNDFAKATDQLKILKENSQNLIQILDDSKEFFKNDRNDDYDKNIEAIKRFQGEIDQQKLRMDEICAKLNELIRPDGDQIQIIGEGIQNNIIILIDTYIGYMILYQFVNDGNQMGYYQKYQNYQQNVQFMLEDKNENLDDQIFDKVLQEIQQLVE